MDLLPGILSLLIAAAGWFYMFYSRAALKLQGIEPPAVNRLRIRLRQTGGATMILLATSFYAGFVALQRNRTALFATLMLAVFVLMGIIMILGLIDLRMTSRLRKSQRERNQP